MLGIVSDSEFESELVNDAVPEIKVPSIIIPLPTPGRSKGDNNVPNGLRNIIGDTAISEGNDAGKELASRFGISASSVSAYKHGSTSTDSYDKQPNLNQINQVKERISKKARRKLFQSLNNITETKLADAKPEALANIAKAMSGIVKDMESDDVKDMDKKPTAQIVVYSPQITQENNYEVIYAKE